MPIPDFQTVMLPLLKVISDGQEHAKSSYEAAIADHFALTDAERARLIPSGGQRLYENRIAWAVSYLAKAGLVERTGRGRVRITDRGRMVLASRLDRVDVRYLRRFPGYVEFRRATGDEPSAPVADAEIVQTPAEVIAESYRAHRSALAEELLDRIRRASPAFFERLVIDLLVAMGYGGSESDAARAVGGSGDEGIDGIIKEDKLGLDFVYVQAKRWSAPVPRPTVQAFAGSLEGQRARKGVLITTSTFTNEAQDYVRRIEKRIVLIDGEQLAEFLIDHGVGVTDFAVFRLRRVDADYFE